jgi:hypothetical protein
MTEDDATIEARIRASIERDMADPEYVAHLNESFDDLRHGRFMSSDVLMLPIPHWAKRVLSYLQQRLDPRMRSMRATVMQESATWAPLTVHPSGTPSTSEPIREADANPNP